MPLTIFVTGASGFIGRCLVERQATSTDNVIKILTRVTPIALTTGLGRVEEVVGDLLKPETYQAALLDCDVVVHLAAATGRASDSQYQRVNVDGTGALLLACRTAGVRKIIYVSTIAAGYSNKRYYQYAKTKAKAETLVRESGLDFVIVRPTLVVGQNSPIWKSLTKIAGLPIVPLLQDHPVRVQPIHVDDVVRGVDYLLTNNRYQGDTLELGGPYPLSMREFLQMVQSSLRGAPGNIVRIPLAPIRFAMAAMELLARSFMPVTAGQLSVFANDSIASENWLLAVLQPGMQSTKQTVAALVATDRNLRDVGARKPIPENALFSDRLQTLLGDECRSFSTYLIGSPPSAYVKDQYALAARARGLACDQSFSCFDRATLRIARHGHIFTRCVDAYCAIFCRSGALRRKLVLLVAILEHVEPSSEAFDRIDAGGTMQMLLSLSAYGLTFVFSLLLGTALLLPVAGLCWIATHVRGNVVAKQVQ